MQSPLTVTCHSLCLLEADVTIVIRILLSAGTHVSVSLWGLSERPV